MRPLRVGAMFAGYEGIGLALQAELGAEPAWFAEYEAAPSKILAHHYPDVPNHGDVTRIDWATVEPVDIITGGSPCQDMSHAGKRAGMKDGTRSGLWSYMRDAINAIRPSLVVWENVRGALSADADSDMESCPGCVGGSDDGPVLRALGRVLGDLADIGYDAAWTGLRAADVGAPHGRFRVFVVAWPTADAISGGCDGWPAQLGRTSVHVAGNDPRTAADADRLRRERAGIARDGRAGLADGGIPAGRVTLLPTPTTTQRGTDVNLDTRDGARANLHNAVADFGQYAPAVAHWEAITRPAPSPTEPTGKAGAHRLSPRFVEWMMGLPDGWVTDVPGVSRNDQLKALGNGVVPQQCAAAIRHLLAAMEAAA